MDLKERFYKMFGAMPDCDSRWEEIESHYGNPDRTYHNKNHLVDCFGYFDDYFPKKFIYRDLLEKQRLEVAIWYHDLIYVPERIDNEFQSAKRAYDLLGSQKIADMIMATRTHVSADDLTKYLCDIDLAPLAKKEGFFQDSQNIRKEYKFLSDSDWNQGRNKFLREMAARPLIYQTPEFQQAFELKARLNLVKAIEWTK